MRLITVWAVPSRCACLSEAECPSGPDHLAVQLVTSLLFFQGPAVTEEQALAGSKSALSSVVSANSKAAGLATCPTPPRGTRGSLSIPSVVATEFASVPVCDKQPELVKLSERARAAVSIEEKGPDGRNYFKGVQAPGPEQSSRPLQASAGLQVQCSSSQCGPAVKPPPSPFAAADLDLDRAASDLLSPKALEQDPQLQRIVGLVSWAHGHGHMHERC